MHSSPEVQTQNPRDIKVAIHPNALDRITQRLLLVYLISKKKDEGIYTWAVRTCQSLLALREPDKEGFIVHNEIVFQFRKTGEIWNLVVIEPKDEESYQRAVLSAIRKKYGDG